MARLPALVAAFLLVPAAQAGPPAPDPPPEAGCKAPTTVQGVYVCDGVILEDGRIEWTCDFEEREKTPRAPLPAPEGVVPTLP